jgi:hypothetical protein
MALVLGMAAAHGQPHPQSDLTSISLEDLTQVKVYSAYFDYYDSLGEDGCRLGHTSRPGYTAGNARWAGTEATLSHQFGKHRITRDALPSFAAGQRREGT